MFWLKNKKIKFSLRTLNLSPDSRFVYYLWLWHFLVIFNTWSVHLEITCTYLFQFLMYAWQPIPDISFWLINTSEAPMLWLFFNILHWVLWIALFLEVWAMKPGVLCGVRQVIVVQQHYHDKTLQKRLVREIIENTIHVYTLYYI